MCFLEIVALVIQKLLTEMKWKNIQHRILFLTLASVGFFELKAVKLLLQK